MLPVAYDSIRLCYPGEIMMVEDICTPFQKYFGLVIAGFDLKGAKCFKTAATGHAEAREAAKSQASAESPQ
jgi:hypothetical protein